MTPSKKQQKQDNAQPQPTTTIVTPAPQPMAQTAQAAPAKPEQKKEETKQMKAVMALVVALREQRGINVDASRLKQDGKFICITPADGWPEIQIGTGGGYNLPQVKSYPKADVACMLKADELWKKQQERQAKKSATATASTPTAKTPEQTAVSA